MKNCASGEKRYRNRKKTETTEKKKLYVRMGKGRRKQYKHFLEVKNEVTRKRRNKLP